MRRVGGFKLGVEGSQDYDLSLRVIELINDSTIRHIPHILYHWRAVQGSVALASGEKDYAHARARDAIRQHFQRKNVEATVTPGAASYHRVNYGFELNPPRVSLITLARDDTNSVQELLADLRSKTDYQSFELIVAVGTAAASTKFKESTTSRDGDVKLHVVDVGSASVAEAYNVAVKHAEGLVICFIAANLRVKTGGWLREMCGHVLREEIGAVGAKLFYPHGTISHAGHILGIKGGVGISHHHFPSDSHGHMSRLQVIQNVSAVSAQCMAIRKQVFEEAEGFDETHFPNAYLDVDLCLRLRERGMRNLFTPYAQLTKARDRAAVSSNFMGEASNELTSLHNKWRHAIERDPYYNCNLTLEREDFSLSIPPRVKKIWST